MKNLEYVRIINQKEKIDFIESLISNYNSNTILSQKNLNDNKDILICEYHKFEEEIIQKYKIDLKKFNSKVTLWKEKKCECGKNLNFINAFNFWGCSDYQNRNKTHSTFAEDQDIKFSQQFKSIKVRLSHNWSTEILKRSNLQGKIKAKELLLFYNSEGLEDLREKFGFKNSLESISAFVYANQNSKKEEKAIKDYLKPYFEKVSDQVYIKYKEKQASEKICIIDLIVSDNDCVYLIEIKRHNIYIDEQQLELYFELLNYLMKNNDDKRSLKSIFIVNEFYESSYNFNKCVKFDELNLNTNKSEIVKEFEKNLFK